MVAGGIKSTNLYRTLHGSVSTTDHALDGVAVVSDIVASSEPKLASQRLKSILTQFRQNSAHKLQGRSAQDILSSVVGLMKEIRSINPLVHQITNTVVATQSANVTLAVGASPIMATEPLEMEDMTRIAGALLVNIGTMRAENLEGMVKAGMHYYVLKEVA